MSNSLVASLPQQNLDALAVIVRTGLGDAAEAGDTMLACLIDVGEALIRAKKQAGHGGWLKWLKCECDLSADSAERLITLARGKVYLNSARVRNLSLTGALKLIKQAESDQKSDQQAKAIIDRLEVGKVSAAAATGIQRQPPKSRSIAAEKPTSSFDAPPLGWWASASLEQRRRLLDGAGFASVNEALPTWFWTKLGDKYQARLDALAEELRQRDDVIDELRRQIAVLRGASEDDSSDIPAFLRRQAA